MAPDLTIATWIWGNKYPGHYLARLKQGVKDHLAQDFRWLVFTPMEGDEHLLPGCFVRLRMFSPAWQRAHQIVEGSRLVCLDLDCVVTGRLDPLFDRDESFLILKGCNAANPCVFNGSAMMLRAGCHSEIWNDFSLDAAAKSPYYEFPDDQGWIWHKLPHADGWWAGGKSGIYGFKKPGWPPGDALPHDARLVAFPGKRDPSQFTHLPWVRKYWR